MFKSVFISICVALAICLQMSYSSVTHAQTNAGAASASTSPVVSTTLVGPGLSTRILIAAEPTLPDAFAAEELSTYLEKLTGQAVTVIKSDDALTGDAKSPLIVLGLHPLNADLKAGELDHDAFIIDVTPHTMRIAGHYIQAEPKPGKPAEYPHNRGTLNGVYTFLDQQGVRWYNPKPYGEHVPHKDVIAAPQGRQMHKPAYRYRMGATLYRWFPDQTDEQWAMVKLWDRRNRTNRFFSGGKGHMTLVRSFGGSTAIPTHHNIHNYFPASLYNEHPEYFAMINGERVKPGKYYHICVSNPRVQEIVIENILERFRKAGHDKSIESAISLEPSDGNQFCDCGPCRALDDPNLLARNGGLPRLGNASMSNRVVFFSNKVLEGVNKEYPNVRGAILAYLAHSEVPTLVKPHPNLIVAPTTMAAAYGDHSKFLDDPDSVGNRNFKELLEGWSKLAPMVTREYFSGGTWYGPIPTLHVLQDRFKRYREYNVQGIVNEVHPSWGPQGIMHYFLLRLQWDPDVDLKQELREYCNNMYGPGADAMYNYFMVMEEKSLAGPAYFFSARFIDRLFVMEGVLEAMTPHIMEAKRLIGDQQPYATRLEGDLAGYEVVRVRRLVEDLKKQQKKTEAVAAWRELRAFILSDEQNHHFSSLFHYTWKVMSQQAQMPFDPYPKKD